VTGVHISLLLNKNHEISINKNAKFTEGMAKYIVSLESNCVHCVGWKIYGHDFSICFRYKTRWHLWLSEAG